MLLRGADSMFEGTLENLKEIRRDLYVRLSNGPVNSDFAELSKAYALIDSQILTRELQLQSRGQSTEKES